MWNPVYFNYGIAVHGAGNVPSYPASHGCVRIPMHIGNYFPSLVKYGDQVFVFDGVKEPEAYGAQVPPFNTPDPNYTTTTSSTTTTTTVAPTTRPAPTAGADHPGAPPPTEPPTTPAPASTAAPGNGQGGEPAAVHALRPPRPPIAAGRATGAGEPSAEPAQQLLGAGSPARRAWR